MYKLHENSDTVIANNLLSGQHESIIALLVQTYMLACKVAAEGYDDLAQTAAYFLYDIQETLRLKCNEAGCDLEDIKIGQELLDKMDIAVKSVTFPVPQDLGQLELFTKQHIA